MLHSIGTYSLVAYGLLLAGLGFYAKRLFSRIVAEQLAGVGNDRHLQAELLATERRVNRTLSAGVITVALTIPGIFWTAPFWYLRNSKPI
jgi:hypothetical protein